MPCSFCGTVGHNRRTCIRMLRIQTQLPALAISRQDRNLRSQQPRFMSRWRTPAQIHHEEQDPVNTTRAAALVETLTEVIETEEQTNVETEDNNMEDNNHGR